jgi:hypothetical protein
MGMALSNEILGRFTAQEDSRYHLSKTWVQGGYEWATDGRLMVGFACDLPDTEDGNFPNAASLFGSQVPLAEPLPIALPEPDNRDVCYECRGLKMVTRYCPACKGDGEVECENCGNEMPCRHCGGYGRIPDYAKDERCRLCGGTGNDYADVSYAGRKFKGYFVAKIVRYLPPARFVAARSEEVTEAMFFEFDGGKGALMPVHP